MGVVLWITRVVWPITLRLTWSLMERPSPESPARDGDAQEPGHCPFPPPRRATTSKSTSRSDLLVVMSGWSLDPSNMPFAHEEFELPAWRNWEANAHSHSERWTTRN